MPDDTDVELVTRIMTSFYNYLLHHNVSPEYEHRIKAAQSVCLLAQKELPMVQKVMATMPGPFNNACSFIFGGRYAQAHSSNNTWDSSTLDDPSMRIQEAHIIFTTAVAIAGNDGMFQTFGSDHVASLIARQLQHEQPTTGGNTPIWCSSEIETSLEVLRIERASEEVRAAYKEIQKDAVKKGMNLRPIGKLICKRWTPTSFERSDLPKGVAFYTPDIGDNYEFWLEDDIFAHWCEGMKFHCTLRRVEWLDNGERAGMWYIDSSGAAYCSFYTVLLNQLMDKPYKPVVFKSDMEAAEAEMRANAEREDDDDLEG